MSPRKEKALQALLTSRTKGEAAAAAGVGESTLRAYLKDPEFKKRYREAFVYMVQDAARQGQRALSPALSALQEIVVDPEETAQARISAARALLENAMKLGELVDVLERLEELEMWKEAFDEKRR